MYIGGLANCLANPVQQHGNDDDDDAENSEDDERNEEGLGESPDTPYLSEQPVYAEEGFIKVPIDVREAAVGVNSTFDSRLKNFGGLVLDASPVDMFYHFCPRGYFLTETVVATLVSMCLEVPDSMFTMLDFDLYVTILFAMTLFKHDDKRVFWSTEDEGNFIHLFQPKMKFNKYMSRFRFEFIAKHLKLCGVDKKPIQRDRLWETRPLIRAFNENMLNSYFASHIVCIDESMHKLSMLYVPAAVFVMRKFTTRGNEYHTIADGIKVLFYMELVEGKSRPQWMGPKEFDVAFGKTTGLLLRIVRYSGLEGSGRVVVLDSGFQVLQALIELLKRGVYASAIIKWKGNWPKGVDGDLMESEAMKLITGESAAMRGTKNGAAFYLWVLRDSMYVLKFMTTYGTTNTHISATPVRRKACIPGAPQVVFKHDVVCYNYYAHRNAVDVNNNGRQKCDPLEETVLSQSYSQRVFCHVLNTCEQNALRAYNHFVLKPRGSPPLSVRDFRIQHIEAVFSKVCMPVMSPGVAARKRAASADDEVQHMLDTIPHFSRYKAGSGWQQDLKMKYVQRTCQLCGSKTSQYCKCNPNHSICQGCFLKHIHMGR